MRLSARRANDSRLAGFVGGMEDGSGGVDIVKHFICYLQFKLLIVLLWCAYVRPLFCTVFHLLFVRSTELDYVNTDNIQRANSDYRFGER